MTNQNSKSADLATEHFNRKLDTFEAYVHLAESCFALRDEAEPLLPPPHDRAAFMTIDDCIRTGTSQGEMILRFADREIAEFDGALRGYGYRTVFASDREMIADARKRVAYLRRGKKFAIVDAFDED